MSRRADFAQMALTKAIKTVFGIQLTAVTLGGHFLSRSATSTRRACQRNVPARNDYMDHPRG
jgi:hypothetical protein